MHLFALHYLYAEGEYNMTGKKSEKRSEFKCKESRVKKNLNVLRLEWREVCRKLKSDGGSSGLGIRPTLLF